MKTRPILVLLVGEALESFPQLLRWFDSRGCRCQLAQSCRDACNLVSSAQFDIVLSQYQLPDRTAFPLLDRLVGSPATLFFSTRVEDDSLWLKMIERGNRCVGAPLLRSDDLTKALGGILDTAVESYEGEDLASGVSKSSYTSSPLCASPK
jgi:CheY-like chemotaxis protein